jgi:GAF domain-containing protein
VPAGAGDRRARDGATGDGPAPTSARAGEVLRTTLDLLRMVDTASSDGIIQYGLDESVRLSGSRIGYLHFVNADRETIRLHTWSTSTKTSCTAVEATHYPIAVAGIWVDCVHRRGPVIHNDYAAEPHRKGLPQGHVALLRDLAVPIFEDGQIVAVMGVGNKELPYDQDDVDLAQLLAGTIWSIVLRKRAQERLREEVAARTEELRQRNLELQQALDDVRVLSGVVPICSYCKQIRDDQGYWNQLESYLSAHSAARFSHGICPSCARKVFPDIDLEETRD